MLPTSLRAFVIAMAAAPIAGGAVAQSPQATQPTVESLQRQLRERDATIADLLRRVEALEQRVPALAPVPVASSQAAPRAVQARPPSGQPAQAPAQPSTTAQEDEEVARALERTLVQQGALVLAPGTYEIVPSLSYTYINTSGLALIAPATVANVERRRDIVRSELTGRVGLPWGFQADLTVPYVYDQEELTTAAALTRTRRDNGFGDVELGLTKQLLYERGWVPDLLAAVRWKSTTGDDDVPSGFVGSLGTGFDSLQAGVTLLKRQDPLAFFGSLAYTYNFDTTRAGVELEPGNGYGVRAGVVLAASPDTSLRFAVENTFLERLKANGVKVEGSDQVVTTLEIGAASVLTASTLLDFSVAAGLTNESPDFIVTLSLPVRF